MQFKTATHSLAYPVTLADGTTLDVITLNEPNIDAIERMEEIGIEKDKEMTVRQVRQMLVVISGLDNATVGKLHPKDFQALGELTGPLLDSSEGDSGGAPGAKTSATP